MPAISAAQVKQLRDATGAGMMDAKRALQDADGDIDQAAKLVRERTGAKMDARASDRQADEGLVHAYLHAPQPGLPPKIGVLLELNCETDFVAKGEAFRTLANDLALHIAAADPSAVAVEDLPEAELEQERAFAHTQARAEGKPEPVVERIVEGRLAAYAKDRALLSQSFVRDPSRTVGELLAEMQRTSGEKVQVARFARFKVGG